MENYVDQMALDMQWEGGVPGRRHTAYFLDGMNPADCRQEPTATGSSRASGVWDERPDYSSSDPLYSQLGSRSEHDNGLAQLKERYAVLHNIKPEELDLLLDDWLKDKPPVMEKEQYLVHRLTVSMEKPEREMRQKMELTGD